MSKGSSSSSSASTTQSVNEDNRAAADNGGIALGKNATLIQTDEFSDNVAKAFNDLISLAKDAGSVAVEAQTAAMQNAEAALNKLAQQSSDALTAVSQRLETQEAGEDSIYTKIFPYIVVVAVAVIIAIAVMSFRRNK